MRRMSLALLLLALSVPAAAQEAESADPAPSTGPAGLDVPSVQPASPAVMKKQSEEMAEGMRTSLKHVLAMIEKARANRDVVLLNCLNEKLGQMKALVRVGEQSNVNLQEFLAKDQVEGAIHERRKIGLASEKVKNLSTEAEGCLGESGAVGGGRTVVTVDSPEFPGDPTHLDQVPGEDVPETPPSASPYN